MSNNGPFEATKEKKTKFLFLLHKFRIQRSMFHSLKEKILQLQVSHCVGGILCLILVVECFTQFGTYNYTHIPAEEVESQLFYHRSPNLVVKKGKPNCNYEHILKSDVTTDPLDIPHKFDSFNAIGINNGSYVPEECNPMFSVAIIVPYKNRQKQWDVFLPYMHNFLRKQQIHYKVYLIEQQDEHTFNKGILLNVGAKQAIKDKFSCLILHDVDTLPLDARNLYACTNTPRHMSASVDKFRNVLPYDYLVGGALAIKADHYKKVNGYSNRFEGWGGEDDDFANRLKANDLHFIRFPRTMSRYTMLYHPKEKENPLRFKIISENKYSRDVDGLSSLHLLDTTVKNHRLFTLIGVKLY